MQDVCVLGGFLAITAMCGKAVHAVGFMQL